MQKAELEALLLAKREEMSARIKKIESDIRQRSISKSGSQQSVERANDDVLAALEQEAYEELELTHHALERMAQGEFGDCLKCGEAISDERLRALPFTQYCRDCAHIKSATQ